jgi:hypothetical protein
MSRLSDYIILGGVRMDVSNQTVEMLKEGGYWTGGSEWSHGSKWVPLWNGDMGYTKFTLRLHCVKEGKLRGFHLSAAVHRSGVMDDGFTPKGEVTSVLLCATCGSKYSARYPYTTWESDGSDYSLLQAAERRKKVTLVEN